MKTSFKWAFDAIGTRWEIDVNGVSNDKSELARVIQSRVEKFDKTYSRFRNDSWVTQISKQKGMYQIPSDASPLFDLYAKLYTISDGLISPLVGNLLSDSGYDATYSLTSKKLHKPPSWDQALAYEFPKLEIKIPALLDFGAAGKGYLVDIIGILLEENNVTDYCIDGGGDILYKSSLDKQITIGLENPQNTQQVIGTVQILNQSVCGSSTNRRKWGKFHHVMNPKTLKPVDDVLATWVIADQAIIADGLSTALFFVSGEKLQKHFSFEYILLRPDLTIQKSKNLKAELYYT